ncbi:Methionyl-tRNA formyltransferase [Metarhizium rileyi]|uniref:Methionyl-tRNA formyltransferase n=1 Tax=Metarhizium rileyi (strain RCEF 4871) TaxID=1649241 RepID=A0A5C6GQ92_METRR|nr:Methionyl-tRNA formyltransferase [Metarhizium rileyi]
MMRRLTESSQESHQHEPAANASQQFQSTPRFGPSSATRLSQRRCHDLEDVDEDGDESYDESLGRETKSDKERLLDSIEIRSDGSACVDAALLSQSPCCPGDLIEGVPDTDSSSLSPDGREAKRRRLSISPARSSFLGTPEVATTFTERHMSPADDERPISPKHAEGLGRRHQPVFRPAPRFKPTENEAPPILPEAFSPQRRGAKYLPGGHAAQLQGWLSEVKGWEGTREDDCVLRLTVEDVSPGEHMYLVRGREGRDDGLKAYILAGEGKLTGLGGRAAVTLGSVVVIEQPVWELNLPIHQRESFRNWDLPNGTNLIIVVSFGLFVPPRILTSAHYGGLNVHPSLLPDLRGPAPIHHALLRGDTHVGISLQTLDPKAFDHGAVLAQSPAPGIPIPPEASFREVLSAAAVEGAEMLIQGLRAGVHVPPRRDVGWKAAELAGAQLAYAPKITKADGQMDWSAWTAEQICRRIRVLGSVWTHAVGEKGVRKRVIILDGEAVPDGDVLRHYRQGRLVCEDEGVQGEQTGRHEVEVRVREDGSCLLGIQRRSWVRVQKVKVEGKPEQMAAVGLGSFIR